MSSGTKSRQNSENGGLPNYSDEEDDDSWMPFLRSAPYGVTEKDGWDLGGFVSPFQSTPIEKVHMIAEALELTKKDVVYDLGCGDGRFIIECCRLAKCRGVGVELDERLVAKARQNAAAVGGVRAEFRRGDFLDPKLDLHQATVIFVYLLPEALDLLSHRLEELVRCSASLRCIVSLRWAFPGMTASFGGREENFFLYRAEDLRRQAFASGSSMTKNA